MEESKFEEVDCVICLDKQPTKIIDPCRHKCLCDDCSTKVEQAKLECPLCRQPILSIIEDDNQLIAKVHKEDWENFQRRKKDYVARFGAKGNALFKGNSKQARAVKRFATSELEQRYKETKGTEIYTAKGKKTEEEDGRLKVEYKVGRKTFKEDYPLGDIPEELEDKEDLELATEHPEVYWLRWHKNKKMKI